MVERRSGAARARRSNSSAVAKPSGRSCFEGPCGSEGGESRAANLKRPTEATRAGVVDVERLSDSEWAPAADSSVPARQSGLEVGNVGRWSDFEGLGEAAAVSSGKFGSPQRSGAGSRGHIQRARPSGLQRPIRAPQQCRAGPSVRFERPSDDERDRRGRLRASQHAERSRRGRFRAFWRGRVVWNGPEVGKLGICCVFKPGRCESSTGASGASKTPCQTFSVHAQAQ